ncbi:MAG: glycosyltransferase [Deferribacterales bacterium]
MRILHIEAGKNLYGGAKQVLYLIEGLNKKGVENILLTPKVSEIAKYSKDIAKVVEIDFLGDIDITFPFRLMKIIDQYRPDIINIHSRKGVDFWGGIVGKLKNIPTICTRRVDNPENKILVKFKYSFYDKVVAISDGIKEVLLTEGLKNDKLLTIRSAIDPTPFRQIAKREEFLKEFNLADNNIVIGVIAQLIERKGHRYLIEIIPDILRVFPDLRVLFFGKGDYKGYLEKLIKEKGIEEYFIFAGFRDDLHKWLGNLDIVVHPAEMEGLGVSLIQVAAAGVPIVATRGGGIPEIVFDGVNGFLIEKGDTKMLFEKVSILLKSNKLRKEMGEAGKRIVDEYFSVDEMVNGYYKLYHDIK